MSQPFRVKLLIVFAGVLFFCCAIFGAHVPTLDESVSLRSAGGAHISPDGKFVVYSVQETNWKDNEYVAQLWLADVDTGRTFQLTRGKKSAENARWSPDGRWISFVAERDATGGATPAVPEKDDPKVAARQIWLISPQGGEAWQLTRQESNVGGYEWSEDGKKIAFTAPPKEPKATKDRKEKYSDYEVFEKDYAQNHLWMVDVAAAAERMTPVNSVPIVTDKNLNIEGFSWSRNSERIAFTAVPNPLVAFSQEADIYLVEVKAPHAVTKIVALKGPDRAPVFSPDDKHLAFVTALGQEYNYYLNSHIAVVDVDRVLVHPATTPADVIDLTAQFGEDPQLIDWGPDGIYLGALQKTSSHVFRLDPQTRKVTRLSAPDDFAGGGFSFTKDFRRMAYTAATARQIAEVFESPVSSFAPRQLTDMNAQIRDWTVGSVEMISWKSQDGTTIEGVLHKPANFDPQKKYPLLVVIHGGPTGVSRAVLNPGNRYYPIEIFLSKGAVVLEPNYRGSAGYGEKFRSLNVRNLGVGDMWDVMSGVDALIAKGFVDSHRMAAMGWSQGGYISAFLTTNTDRFKAISVGAGISDWMTYYVSTDITPFTRQYLHATPWDDPAIYALTSPITHIKNAKTPTLIQQGQFDKRVPVPDSFELYRGLLDQNIESRFIMYAGFGHGITKPKSNRAVLEHNLDWFSHYIWGEPIPKDSPLWGSGEKSAQEETK
ncbi:MAG: S9 family peptidase [Acidobacteriia bacterium]|nr:S9 family peptidase [Terriglobia bacterium]